MQLCQNFGISGGVWTPPPSPSARHWHRVSVYITYHLPKKLTLKQKSNKGRVTFMINKYESFRQKFKENWILTETSVYILEVLCYIKKYKGDLKHNCEIHEYKTRSKYDLHTQSCNTFLLQNSVLHVGVRLYKHLPLKIKKKTW